jgi:hypothetical protein
MRKLLFGMIVTLCLAAIAPQSQAQTNDCPVSISDVRNLDTRIFVQFTNVSTKQLRDYEFGLTFVGTDGVEHTYPETLSAVSKVQHRKRFMATWKSPYTLDFLYPQARAYLLRATFTNGTTWSDDGSHSCGFTARDE